MASISELTRQAEELDFVLNNEIIQYQEQGVFIDYIAKTELLPTMIRRMRHANVLAATGTPREIAEFLIVYPGIHTRESLLPVLNSRIENLNQRISKLQQKEDRNGNINS